MAESVDLILRLLQEQREEQKRTNDQLGDLRVAIASVGRTVDGQQEGIAGMRIDQAQIFDRLRLVEAQAQNIPRLEAKHEAIDHRVRNLEQDGASAKVVSGGVTSTAKELFKWALALAAGFFLAWSTRH